jgi:hypothetical protein
MSKLTLPDEGDWSGSEPESKVWGQHDSFSLVGNGNVTNSRCGTF